MLVTVKIKKADDVTAAVGSSFLSAFFQPSLHFFFFCCFGLRAVGTRRIGPTSATFCFEVGMRYHLSIYLSKNTAARPTWQVHYNFNGELLQSCYVLPSCIVLQFTLHNRKGSAHINQLDFLTLTIRTYLSDVTDIRPSINVEIIEIITVKLYIEMVFIIC